MADNFLLKKITKKFVESKMCAGKLRIQHGIIRYSYIKQFYRYSQKKLLWRGQNFNILLFLI